MLLFSSHFSMIMWFLFNDRVIFTHVFTCSACFCFFFFTCKNLMKHQLLCCFEHFLMFPYIRSIPNWRRLIFFRCFSGVQGVPTTNQSWLSRHRRHDFRSCPPAVGLSWTKVPLNRCDSTRGGCRPSLPSLPMSGRFFQEKIPQQKKYCLKYGSIPSFEDPEISIDRPLFSEFKVLWKKCTGMHTRFLFLYIISYGIVRKFMDNTPT